MSKNKLDHSCQPLGDFISSQENMFKKTADGFYRPLGGFWFQRKTTSKNSRRLAGASTLGFHMELMPTKKLTISIEPLTHSTAGAYSIIYSTCSLLTRVEKPTSIIFFLMAKKEVQPNKEVQYQKRYSTKSGTVPKEVQYQKRYSTKKR